MIGQKKKEKIKLMINLEKKIITPGSYLTGMVYFESPKNFSNQNFSLQLQILGFEKILISKQVSIKSVIGSKFLKKFPERKIKSSNMCIVDEENTNYFIKHKFEVFNKIKSLQKNFLENSQIENFQLAIPFSILLPPSLPSSFNLKYPLRFEDKIYLDKNSNQCYQTASVQYQALIVLNSYFGSIRSSQDFLIQQIFLNDLSYWPKISYIKFFPGIFCTNLKAKIQACCHKEKYKFGEKVYIKFKKLKGMSRKRFESVEGKIKRVIVFKTEGGKIKKIENVLWNQEKKCEILVKENFVKFEFLLKDDWKFWDFKSRVGYLPSCKSSQVSCEYVFESSLKIKIFFCEKKFELEKILIPVFQDSRIIRSNYFKPEIGNWNPLIIESKIFGVNKNKQNFILAQNLKKNFEKENIFLKKNLISGKFDICGYSEDPPESTFFNDEFMLYCPKNEEEQEEESIDFEFDVDDRIDRSEFFVFRDGGNKLEKMKFVLSEDEFTEGGLSTERHLN